MNNVGGRSPVQRGPRIGGCAARVLRALPCGKVKACKCKNRAQEGHDYCGIHLRAHAQPDERSDHAA